MSTLDKIHESHSELYSEAAFLKKEIHFLTKILKNCYSTSINDERVKTLDSYWKSFDKNLNDLDDLEASVQSEENKYISSSKDISGDFIFVESKENEFNLKMSQILSDVKLQKEKFYEFMRDCNACALKVN